MKHLNRRRELHVQPHARGWSITYDGELLGVTTLKRDALRIATTLGELSGLAGSTSLYVHKRWRNRIVEERTYRRADDPPETPG